MTTTPAYTATGAPGEDALRLQPVAKTPRASATRRLAEGAATAMALKLAGGVVALGVQLLLARWLGATQFGEYVLVMSWLAMAAMLAKCGWETASNRFVAEYAATQQWGYLLGFRQVRRRAVLLASLAVAGLASLVLAVFADQFSPTLYRSLWLMIALIPIVAICDLAANDLRNRQFIAWASGPPLILKPLLAVAIVWLALAAGVARESPLVVAAMAGASGFVLLVLAWRASTAFPQARGAAPQFQRALWWSTMLPLFGIAGCNLILAQSDILLIGLLCGPQDAGIYNVAVRLVSVIPLGLATVNAVGAPLLSEQFALHDRHELQRVARGMAWGSLLISLPAALAALVGGPWLLSIFGPEFPAGYWPLAVLAIGQLVNGLAGSVGQLLSMTGHQQALARVLVVFAILQLALSALLIPTWGLLGAALATTVSRIGWNVTLCFLVWQKVGVDPTVFGLHFRTQGER